MQLTRIILYTCVFLFLGCGDEPEVMSKPIEPVVEMNEVDSDVTCEGMLPKKSNLFKLHDWKTKFLYQTPITIFNEDSLKSFYSNNWLQDDEETFVAAPVIGELYRQIEGVEKLEEWHVNISEGTNFLYSIQKDDGFVGITLVGMNDAWVNEIKYLTFDQRGRKIGEFLLASDGGDGGYYTKGHGEFLNDSTYHYSFIETELNWETKEDEVLEQGTITTTINSKGEINSVVKKV